MVQMAGEPVPRAPGAWPLLGHALPLLRDPLSFVRSLPARGDLVRVRLGPTEAFVVCSPELTRQVLVADRVFDKGGPLYERARDLFGNGLGTCAHDRHRRQRRLTQPAFHHTRLPGYAETMAAQVGAVVDGWQDGQTIDVLAEMQNLTTRALVATMFSTSMADDLLDRSIDDVSVFVAGIYRSAVTPKALSHLPIPANRRYQRSIRRLRDAISSVVSERKNHPDGGHDRSDLLSALLENMETGHDTTDDRGFSEEEICDQVITFFFAGSETTATTLAWSFQLLDEHPELHRALQAEVATVLAGGPAGFEHLPRLTLTTRIISETLRLYPPAGLLTRTVTEDTRLGGHSLSAGATVIFSPYLIHRLPGVCPRPDEFDPGRWLETAGSAPAREAYLPFGAGARKCVGDQFAVMEAVLALASVTARWHLQGLPGQHVDPSAIFGMRPNGLRMRLRAAAPHAVPS